MIAISILMFRLSVDDSNKKTILPSSEDRPFYLMLFSPYCGHCKAVHPTWEDLMKHYENDTKITIGDVDCTIHGNICNEFPLAGYPTFISVIRHNATKVVVPRTFESFHAQAEEMKSVYLSPSIPCNNFNSTVSLPAFVYCFPTEDSNPCQTVRMVLSSFDKRYPPVYIDNCSQSGFFALFSDARTVSMGGNFSVEGSISFINEFNIQPFSAVAYERFLTFTRPAIIVVANGSKRIIDYQSISEANRDRFAFLKCTQIQFAKAFPSAKADGSIIITNRQKNQWGLINDLGKGEELKEAIKRVESGKFEFEHSESLKSLFAFETVEAQKAKEKRVSSIRMLVVSFITGLSATSLFVWVAKIRTSKLE